MVKAQIDSRRHDSLQAMTTIEGAMERNVALSEANGMDFVMKLPEFTIESLTFDIEQLKGELNEEEKDVDN